MASSPSRDSGSHSHEIGDAAHLFLEDEAATPSPSQAASFSPGSLAQEGYELEPASQAEPSQRPLPEDVSPAPQGPRPTASIDDDERRTRAKSDELAAADDVDPLWSRWAESGRHYVLLAALAIGLCYVSYGLFQAGQFGLVPLFLLGSIPLFVLLAYPLVITLERPVRMTPEQALKDYYGALNHAWPHHRRMWLLLSTTGKSRPPFGTQGQLTASWNRAKSSIQRRQGAKPARFEVTEYSGDPSKGAARVECKYSLVVYSSQGTLLESHRMKSTLVRGRDRMWYLDDGTPSINYRS
jgi:hypothetical protein